jgi:hypothetical protein
MWLNRGFFADNGKCGYVLKPAAMFVKGFNCYKFDTFQQHVSPISVSVKVGRSLGLCHRSFAHAYIYTCVQVIVGKSSYSHVHDS